MIIGIDLETTFSAVAYMGKDGIPNIIPNRKVERKHTACQKRVKPLPV